MNLTQKHMPQFVNLTETQMRETLIENAYRKDKKSREWFSGFKFAYDSVHGNPAGALDQGLALLNKCRELDEAAYIEIHKGGAFYFLGIASYLVKEFELATFFFDAAVSEDIRAGDDPKAIIGSPAMLFMRLDGEQPNQAARKLVQDAENLFVRWIDHYNLLPGISPNVMSMQLLRERLFIPSILEENQIWRSLTSTFISYCLEWDYRNMLFDIRITPGTYEPFYIHLFKGCLLFESLLKNNKSSDPWIPKDKKHNSLSFVLEKYSMVLGSSSNLGQNISGPDLESVLEDLEQSDSSILTAIKFTARIRNTLGHNLGWNIGLTKIQYQRLFQMIADSCIHAVAKLY